MKLNVKLAGFILLALIMAAAGAAMWFRPTPHDQLWLALADFNMEAIEVAVRQGADVNAPAGKAYRGDITAEDTPVGFASRYYVPRRALEILLEADAKPNVLNRGYSPLQQAVRDEQPKTIRMLLAHGADLNFLSGGPFLTALMLIEEEETGIALVKLGANPDFTAPGGHCMMNYVGQEPKTKLWRELKKHGGRPRKVSPETIHFNYVSPNKFRWEKED